MRKSISYQKTRKIYKELRNKKIKRRIRNLLLFSIRYWKSIAFKLVSILWLCSIPAVIKFSDPLDQTWIGVLSILAFILIVCDVEKLLGPF